VTRQERGGRVRNERERRQKRKIGIIKWKEGCKIKMGRKK